MGQGIEVNMQKLVGERGRHLGMERPVGIDDGEKWIDG